VTEPRIELLDARALGLEDEPALRRHAREVCDAGLSEIRASAGEGTLSGSVDEASGVAERGGVAMHGGVAVHGGDTGEEALPEGTGEASTGETAGTGTGAGVYVSRSYSFPLALIAWHTAQVGCDIERIAPCDEAFADSIYTPTERAAAQSEAAGVAPATVAPVALADGAKGLARDSVETHAQDVEHYNERFFSPSSSLDFPSSSALSTSAHDRRITSLWSSKEALAKALGDALHYDPRRLEGPAGWREGRAGSWRARALDVGEEYVGWVCWRAETGGRSGERRR
jgi:hypothetical protein